MSDQFKWYGEWVPYKNDEEKEEARAYLILWKKFIGIKMSLEIVDEQWVDQSYIIKDCCLDDVFESENTVQTLGLKLQCKVK